MRRCRRAARARRGAVVPIHCRRGAVAGADVPLCLRRTGLVPPSAVLRRWRHGRAGVPPRERGGAAAEARRTIRVRPWCGPISPPLRPLLTNSGRV